MGLENIEETQALAGIANAWGTFDVVIHNAGIYKVEKNSLGSAASSVCRE